MGFLVGIFKRIFKLIAYLAIVVAVILFIPNLPPYTKFTSIEIEPTLPRVGALSHNNVLNNAEHLYEGKLLGPEAFQIYNGEVYTSLATGEIVKLSAGGHVTFVTKIGQPCTGLVQEHICGRPLGFVIDEKNKLLYVADAYLGIWKVNLVTDKKQLLVSPRVAINGRIPKIFNAVALDKNGDVFWTDSSTDYSLRDGVMVCLTDPTGRLFYYNSAKNESTVLLDNIWFANGLVISPDNQFILVAETLKYRLLKYYISGPNKGKSEVFVAGLPGGPDNVRVLPDGSGVLVSLYSAFDDDHPFLIKTMASTPLARKFLSRLVRLIEIPFEFLNTQFPHHIFEEIVYQIGNFASASSFNPPLSGLVQIDWNGKIVASYYNTDSSILHLSDAIVFNDKLYTGCPHIQNYVGAVPVPPLLKKAFSTSKPAIKEQPKIEVRASEKVKPKVDEKKEIPKKSESVSHQQQSKLNTEKQSEQNTQESHVKQNAVPKATENKPNVVSEEAVVKPKVVTKEAESKPKMVKKEVETKPKVVSKDPEAKPKVVTKEAEIKQKAVDKEAKTNPKVVTNEPEVKAKVVTKKAQVKSNVISKEPEVKQKAPESKPKTASKETVKPKVTTKEQEVKPKVASQDTKPSTTKTKPDKETETKSKPSKEADVTSKKVNKESVQIKPVLKSEEPKKESQNPQVKAQKSDGTKGTESKSKPTGDTPSKPIPVEEEIPSDTAKPSKGTLKVIKKSGPQEIPNPNL